jgi:hypothetical protein
MPLVYFEIEALHGADHFFSSMAMSAAYSSGVLTIVAPSREPLAQLVCASPQILAPKYHRRPS